MKNLPRLGVNIDHVATLRNARGENYPSPLKAALLCKEYGADGITAHLREDRRHIKDEDIFEIKEKVDLPLNFEMAPTDEMLQIAIKSKPNACCIVPEKREEVTTEGGIDIKKNHNILAHIIKELKQNSIRVSIFIDPSENQIIEAKNIGADIVEIHTGEFCKNVHLALDYEKSFIRIKEASFLANKIGLEVHLGHGITFESISKLAEIEEIKEFNIGHFIVSESIFLGLKETINEFKRLIKKGRISR
tara:strand:+ start:3321 stop:4064 length:744 start_codon:yes stop_codon:yes gene_type:complete